MRAVGYPEVDRAQTLTGLSPGRRTLFVAVLGGLWTIGSFSIDLYLPALPTLGADLGASQQQVALTLTAFLVGLAVGQVQAGTLSDRHGRRALLLAGLLVYTLASLTCALAPSIHVLATARFVQGLGAAAGMAVSNAAVTDHMRGREAAKLFSLLAMIGGVAPIIAPVAGAQLLRITSWRGLFIALTVIGCTVLLSVFAALPESLPQERRSPLGPGALLRGLLSLTGDRCFMSYAATSALSVACFFAYLAGSSFVYQEVYGISPAAFSFLFAANALGMIGANEVNRRLLGRFSPGRILALALLVNAAAACFALTVLIIGGLPVAALAAPLFVLVAAAGFIGPNSTAMALSLHPEKAGTASAYFGTLRLGLGALATPLVGMGGGLDGVSMGVVMAVAAVLALAVYGVARMGDRGRRPFQPRDP